MPRRLSLWLLATGGVLALPPEPGEGQAVSTQ